MQRTGIIWTIGFSIGWFSLPTFLEPSHTPHSALSFKILEVKDFKSIWMLFLRNYDTVINGAYRTTEKNQEGNTIWVQQEQPSIWVALSTSKRMLGWQELLDSAASNKHQNVEFLIEQWQAGPGMGMELMHNGRDLIPFLVLDIKGVRLATIIDTLEQGADFENVDALLRHIATSDFFIRYGE